MQEEEKEGSQVLLQKVQGSYWIPADVVALFDALPSQPPLQNLYPTRYVQSLPQKSKKKKQSKNPIILKPIYGSHEPKIWLQSFNELKIENVFLSFQKKLLPGSSCLVKENFCVITKQLNVIELINCLLLENYF